jgi:hypothetical protein
MSTVVHSDGNACDFLMVMAARFRILYLFARVEVGTRRIVRCNVTGHRAVLDGLHQEYRSERIAK